MYQGNTYLKLFAVIQEQAAGELSITRVNVGDFGRGESYLPTAQTTLKAVRSIQQTIENWSVSF